MIDELVPLVAQLRKAREHMGLSQRALADRVGLQQGHLSRIERAAVDLQTSNLVQLARAVDLEVVLVPRRSLPAVEALSQQAAQRSFEHAPLVSTLRLQATRLARKFPNVPQLGLLARTLIDLPDAALHRLPPRELSDVLADLERTRRILQAINQEPDSEALGPAFISTVETLESSLRATRARLGDEIAASPSATTPAYTLDDEEPEVP